MKKPFHLQAECVIINQYEQTVGRELPQAITKTDATADAAERRTIMKNLKRVKTLTTKKLADTMKKGGCGECQTSCQSACKTSCTVGNQSCENH